MAPGVDVLSILCGRGGGWQMEGGEGGVDRGRDKRVIRKSKQGGQVMDGRVMCYQVTSSTGGFAR